MKFKTESGREAGLRSIHQMMNNPDYEVVEKEESDATPESVTLKNGGETNWIKVGKEEHDHR